LKLEWNVLNRQWRQQKDMDMDGFVFDTEIENIPEDSNEVHHETDDTMVDAIAQEEEAEVDAMLSLLDTRSSSQVQELSYISSLSDDEDYDTLFMDMLSQQEGDIEGFVSSGQMDMS
jgi:predicted transcriptional regulator